MAEVNAMRETMPQAPRGGGRVWAIMRLSMLFRLLSLLAVLHRMAHYVHVAANPVEWPTNTDDLIGIIVQYPVFQSIPRETIRDVFDKPYRPSSLWSLLGRALAGARDWWKQFQGLKAWQVVDPQKKIAVLSEKLKAGENVLKAENHKLIMLVEQKFLPLDDDETVMKVKQTLHPNVTTPAALKQLLEEQKTQHKKCLSECKDAVMSVPSKMVEPYIDQQHDKFVADCWKKLLEAFELSSLPQPVDGSLKLKETVSLFSARPPQGANDGLRDQEVPKSRSTAPLLEQHPSIVSSKANLQQDLDGTPRKTQVANRPILEGFSSLHSWFFGRHVNPTNANSAKTTTTNNNKSFNSAKTTTTNVLDSPE